MNSTSTPTSPTVTQRLCFLLVENEIVQIEAHLLLRDPNSAFHNVLLPSPHNPAPRGFDARNPLPLPSEVTLAQLRGFYDTLHRGSLQAQARIVPPDLRRVLDTGILAHKFEMLALRDRALDAIGAMDPYHFAAAIDRDATLVVNILRLTWFCGRARRATLRLLMDAADKYDFPALLSELYRRYLLGTAIDGAHSPRPTPFSEPTLPETHLIRLARDHRALHTAWAAHAARAIPLPGPTHCADPAACCAEWARCWGRAAEHPAVLGVDPVDMFRKLSVFWTRLGEMYERSCCSVRNHEARHPVVEYGRKLRVSLGVLFY
ncbi:hypothetical protein DFH09DRAFT_1278516 [Mycena vulgaris]|nr:hypothetical protein DFH09DRAFT_1278516 [Mycena vulgaris]